MTVPSYGYKNDGELDDVLGAEKQEILARLKSCTAGWSSLVLWMPFEHRGIAGEPLIALVFFLNRDSSSAHPPSMIFVNPQ